MLSAGNRKLPRKLGYRLPVWRCGVCGSRCCGARVSGFRDKLYIDIIHVKFNFINVRRHRHSLYKTAVALIS